MANVSFNTDLFDTIGADVKDESVKKKSMKEDRETIQKRKMSHYAGLAAEIWGCKLQKGNLMATARNEFVRLMDERAGLAKTDNKGKIKLDGQGDRYYRGAVGIKRKAKDLGIPTQGGTVDAIADALYTNNIDTEAKLHAFIKDEVGKSEAATIADKIVGSLTYRKDEDGNRIPNGFRESTNDLTLEEIQDEVEYRLRLLAAWKAEAEKEEADKRTMDQLMDALDIE